MIDVTTRCNSCTHIIVCSKKEQFNAAKISLENDSYAVGDNAIMPFASSKDVIISIKCPFYSEVPVSNFRTAIKAELRAANAKTET